MRRASSAKPPAGTQSLLRPQRSRGSWPGSLQRCVTQGRRKEAFLYVRVDWKVLRAEIISGEGT